ncbi:MAG TPA: phosphoribosylformylglycinamidine cyclo-ligase [Deltaproteobacteria bacterium]|nr:phosphoribosylformylglycinamidine cyclo-ligase [Deltaproteobacteria bacterium]
MKSRLTYRSAGVDIDEGERLVRLIKPLAKSTERPGLVSGIGGFGALFSGRFKGMEEPLIVSSTDGVGTKLRVAFMADRHDTVGIDLVAMCVNDIVVSGAEPLFFLDYLACGSLDAVRAARVVRGIAAGCREAGCALAGGETAEMPGMYAAGEYDLAGFAVGVVDRPRLVDGSRVGPGDSVIGLASNGLHSNGYSLARKVFFERMGLGLGDRPRGLRRTLASELLRPTRIYVKPVLALLERPFTVTAMAHITGGGLPENLPRVLPHGVKVEIRRGSWPVPPVFRLLKQGGGLDDEEMMRTFNCGVGFVVIARGGDEEGVLEALNAMGEKAWVIGRVVEGRGAPSVEVVG